MDTQMEAERLAADFTALCGRGPQEAQIDSVTGKPILLGEMGPLRVLALWEAARSVAPFRTCAWHMGPSVPAGNPERRQYAGMIGWPSGQGPLRGDQVVVHLGEQMGRDLAVSAWAGVAAPALATEIGSRNRLLAVQDGFPRLLRAAGVRLERARSVPAAAAVVARLLGPDAVLFASPALDGWKEAEDAACACGPEENLPRDVAAVAFRRGALAVSVSPRIRVIARIMEGASGSAFDLRVSAGFAVAYSPGTILFAP